VGQRRYALAFAHVERNQPQSVTATTAEGADGTRLHFVQNWSFDEVSATAPLALRDVLGDGAVDAGAPVRLGAWDVRVLAEVAG